MKNTRKQLTSLIAASLLSPTIACSTDPEPRTSKLQNLLDHGWIMNSDNGSDKYFNLTRPVNQLNPQIEIKITSHEQFDLLNKKTGERIVFQKPITNYFVNNQPFEEIYGDNPHMLSTHGIWNCENYQQKIHCYQIDDRFTFNVGSDPGFQQQMEFHSLLEEGGFTIDHTMKDPAIRHANMIISFVTQKNYDAVIVDTSTSMNAKDVGKGQDLCDVAAEVAANYHAAGIQVFTFDGKYDSADGELDCSKWSTPLYATIESTVEGGATDLLVVTDGVPSDYARVNLPSDVNLDVVSINSGLAADFVKYVNQVNGEAGHVIAYSTDTGFTRNN